jgi:hypothetical protein
MFRLLLSDSGAGEARLHPGADFVIKDSDCAGGHGRRKQPAELSAYKK